MWGWGYPEAKKIIQPLEPRWGARGLFPDFKRSAGSRKLNVFCRHGFRGRERLNKMGSDFVISMFSLCSSKERIVNTLIPEPDPLSTFLTKRSLCVLRMSIWRFYHAFRTFSTASTRCSGVARLLRHPLKQDVTCLLLLASFCFVKCFEKIHIASCGVQTILF